MKIIVRNAKGVNLRTAPSIESGGIINLALAGTELEIDGIISIYHDTWVKLKEQILYHGVLTDAYCVVKQNGTQYCYFVSEEVGGTTEEFNRGWNACLDAMPARKE